jgi:hypothetical protein
VTQPDRNKPGRLWRLGLSQSLRGSSTRRPGARQGVAVTVTAAPTDSESEGSLSASAHRLLGRDRDFNGGGNRPDGHGRGRLRGLALRGARWRRWRTH